MYLHVCYVYISIVYQHANYIAQLWQGENAVAAKNKLLCEVALKDVTPNSQV